MITVCVCDKYLLVFSVHVTKILSLRQKSNSSLPNSIMKELGHWLQLIYKKNCHVNPVSYSLPCWCVWACVCACMHVRERETVCVYDTSVSVCVCGSIRFTSKRERETGAFESYPCFVNKSKSLGFA